ncbi:GNAT family N-acetyltransferase [Candidatus Bathyarchaeota archaeon]|nr:GNAT family N-acetyltransferase [Candidatus Bathyarchaeota archaeon]
MQSERLQDRISLLKIISEKAKLEEGGEAVEKILREIFRSQKISTRDLAYFTQLPVPVTAAVRRELEHEGLVARNGGAFLTEKGEKFVKEQLGLIYSQRLICPKCQGRSIQIPDKFVPLLKKLRTHLSTRPRPLPWLDQAHGTPETALLRALFMLEKGDVEGRRILFLGDDDFTSIAVGLLRAAREITVVDMDLRLLGAIQHVSKGESFNITCVECDLRKPLPKHLHHKYDVVFTDPPYTITGLTLFISRGITALQLQKGASVYLAYAHKAPKRMLMVQKTLSAMGLAVVEQIPNFNTYEGAGMFANTTFLARLETTEKTKPLITGAFSDKLYTGEITQTVRTYQCRCGEKLMVGVTEAIRTVEDLKGRGCPKCGSVKGFKLIKKQKLKEALVDRLVLRNFAWADFPAVLEFEREIARKSFPKAPILDEAYHRQKLEKAVKRGHDNLKVALLDNEIVGWLWLRTEKDRSTNEKFGYIKTIIVKPKHRHQEFGRKLMKAANHHFLNKGIRRIDLIVSTTNHDAALFFEEVGFERQHSTMRKRLENEEE